jgi:hypothetical protein
MKYILPILVCVASLGSLSSAQDEGGLKKKVKQAVVVTSGPVTKSEATASFQRLEKLIGKVLKTNVPVGSVSGNSNSPVTKSEVILELLRVYRAVEPKFTNTPRAIDIESSRVVVGTGEVRKALLFLIKKGFVGNYGSLATGKTSSLTVEEFGTSLGFFLTRVSECTHTSSTKWTPYLHN